MEAGGNICIATIGECGISVVSPAGELVELVATDDIFTTNIAFGGPDRQDAYITLSGPGRLVKTRWARLGLHLQYLARPLHHETHSLERIGWLRASLFGATDGHASTLPLSAG